MKSQILENWVAIMAIIFERNIILKAHIYQHIYYGTYMIIAYVIKVGQIHFKKMSICCIFFSKQTWIWDYLVLINWKL